ncbi:MAG: class II fumarate hydratase [Phycisphaerae bacterium]|nr:class II fumarate hydratase [Phycisphaerae bacterium]MCZ2401052.1 class II fumarate hydratase [Phycisphaerae bacterium]NUQ50005.1 class II fumarate hydratase [Phycisphaerae bacterium]
MGEFRIERDSMGEMQVPAGAYYGASTQRAVLNFPVSGYRFGREFIRAMGAIKHACAEANASLGKLDRKLAGWIQKAAREVFDGKLDDQFVLDIFQTGSGTSTNMNANEVIANRAIELAGGERGSKLIHPNDHVNMGQSSNDVIPTAIHVAAVEALHRQLMPALHRLREALRAKAEQFDAIVKIGRTHLMDATPIRLGQVFSGYASQIAHADRRIAQKLIILRELPIGGTAVGTGINTHPEFGKRVCDALNHELREQFHEAHNHFEAQAAKDAIVNAMGTLKTVAVALTKIANDVRWLGSGPRTGIGELILPATQPGSSIMPGKVNPVICESVLQVCAHVVGADAAITYAGGLLGTFELHVGMPVMAHHFLEATRVLANVCHVFAEKCIDGLEANTARCEALIEQSLAMCTSLAPLIGYDAAADIAKQAHAGGKNVRQIAQELIRAGKLKLTEAQLNEALDPRRMTEPSDKVLPVSA